MFQSVFRGNSPGGIFGQFNRYCVIRGQPFWWRFRWPIPHGLGFQLEQDVWCLETRDLAVGAGTGMPIEHLLGD